MSNLEIATRMYDALGRGDLTAVLAAMDPGVEWHEAEGNPYQMDGSAWIGPQALVDKLLVSLGTDWDRFALTVTSLHDAGDHVVMQGRYTGTWKGTGRSLDAQACHILRFKDAKLASFQQYCDTAQLQVVMGQ
jgi:ketosteroid isomerase-like protein